MDLPHSPYKTNILTFPLPRGIAYLFALITVIIKPGRLLTATTCLIFLEATCQQPVAKGLVFASVLYILRR